MDRYPVSIKGVLRSPGGELLLMLNERHEWELPGGRLEAGETPQQTLAREIEEELGLAVTVDERPLDSYAFEVVPGRSVFIVSYRCHLSGAFEPQVSAEHLQFGLFDAAVLPLNLPRGYRASIQRALDLKD